ncbi:alpha/beta hydrolase [Gramella sp. AN32]|uniref:Alpha/beta hydrolase family protein n=1 Tax=Christiangramia antarctica TaxID=2058158 RepID=A0ABW5WZ78_9FLAO|nr:alpha/beta hydrolase [Gramella sp. AN32]MCM4154929.1 alpha/beta hydrolase [Gramella sp. AN32]
MEVTKIKNQQIEGKHGRPILTDYIFKQDGKPKRVLIFCHGYKGFKDWGAWDMMGTQFAKNDYFFLKFNFSHNGTNIDNPSEFLDIEAFGDNNYSIELDDLQSVIDEVLSEAFEFASEVDSGKVDLIGHSRGGGIAIIKAAEEPRIGKLVTLASVSDYASRFPDEEKLQIWKEKGVQYILNSRTKQQLPHHFQFYRDFKENEDRLNIQRAAENLKIPHLIVHGSQDTSVSIEEAGKLFEWSPASKLCLVENADHVFGIQHPWEEPILTPEFDYVIENTLEFLQKPSEELWNSYREKAEKE